MIIPGYVKGLRRWDGLGFRVLGVLGCRGWRVRTQYSKAYTKDPLTHLPSSHVLSPLGMWVSQRLHVAIWYILRAQNGSHMPTLGPKYTPYSYMEPLGFRVWAMRPYKFLLV